MSRRPGRRLLGGLGVRNQDAATVNGVGIPTDRLSEMTTAQLGQQATQQSGQQQTQDIEGATRQALEGLIQFQLVLDGAKKAGWPSRSPTSTPAWSSSSSR